ncbi:3-hydroxyacyl-CoA dehydrogenase [Nocardia uniformis]|uniref:enoyl-CoA hydratase n=1 Tax=Nocardia uniformis TaxID=53432 RepID=A0A849CD06_9NOCA|nr:3-hydroxyacyl-CoA dehydrogenase NAD-binding domain-containing protein [Nocardia uniformis]NNH70931.1 3-hydroxyacyl-CoA dehydrogenase [Nocardia uniformis]
MSTNTIRWEKGTDGIVVLTLDDPNQATNTWNADFRESLYAAVDRLTAERESITGVILTSGKETFSAGADLKELAEIVETAETAEIAAFFDEAKACLRRLETLGRPVVAAINGTALGGGLELALATHHRIAVDDSTIQIGLPEVTLGAIPGAGGVVRTVRMLGLADALLNILIKGQKHEPKKALAAGIVDELVATPAELIPAAKAWIAANPAPEQPWDRRGHRIPGGTATDPAMAMNLPAFTSTVRKELKGADFPAARNLLAAAVESTLVDFTAASTIETRYLVNLLQSPITKNMVGAFFNLQRMNKPTGRAVGVEPFTPRRVAVLGAGMMGAGIAYEYARAGAEVVLKDISVESAERGKGYSRALVEKAVSRGRKSQRWADELLARIHPTADTAELAGADVMIEAVFEDADLKKRTYSEVEPLLDPAALLASNTSQIPITGLAEGVSRPEDFIGMHFSSPVEKMPFVEVIKGRLTSAETVARTVDAVRMIGKTPIVVNDGRGFYLTRLFQALTFEALEMLAEGVPAPSIEQAAAQAGLPTQPLLVLDQVSLTLARSIIADRQAAAATAGSGYNERNCDTVVFDMVDKYDRAGRAAGAGFYGYADGKRLGLWPGLRAAFGGDNREISFEDLRERMLFIISLEVVKCLDEGIVETTLTADVGSLMGGMPPWTGGAVTYVNSYHGGVAGFVARARELAAAYGDRFTPPTLLLVATERGASIAS